MREPTTNGEVIDLSAVLDFIDSPATRNEIEAAIVRARQRKLDRAIDAELIAGHFIPSQAIEAWISEKDRSGNAARRNYPREVARWVSFISGGAASLHANSYQRSELKELDDSGRLILSATREDATRYRDSLKETRKPNGIRTTISILGSFYSYLERNQYVKISPFVGISRPAKESRVHVRAIVGQVPVMNDDEIHQVLEVAGRRNNRVGLALGFMAVFGIRVGSIISLEAGRDFIAFRSKGGKTKRILFKDLKAAPRDPEAVASMLKGKTFANWSVGACRVACTRSLSKMHQAGKLSNDFSPHDLRHATAIREYEADHDLIRVMRILGHANVTTTQTYLEGLGISNTQG